MSKYGVISGPYFPAFGLNTERYIVGKYGPEITPYLNTFHVVSIKCKLKFSIKDFLSKYEPAESSVFFTFI